MAAAAVSPGDVDAPPVQARHAPLHACERVPTPRSVGIANGVRPKPKLVDQVRDAMRTRLYSSRTGEAYIGCPADRFVAAKQSV